MLITEPNGVPPTTCPGCDIWLLMENHISMSTPRKNIYMSFFLVYRTSLWYTCPFLFSFLFPSCLDDRGNGGKTSPCFLFFKEHTVFYVKNVLKVKGGIKMISEKRTSVLSNVCEWFFMWNRVFEKKKCEWKEDLFLKYLKENPSFGFGGWMLPEDGEKNGYWFWKNGWGFWKAGIIPKVRIFCF